MHHTLLAMNHFIVREWQEIILLENIHKAESHQVKVIFTIDRIFFVETEDIIHPAHVPFVVKSYIGEGAIISDGVEIDGTDEVQVVGYNEVVGVATDED